MDKKFHIWGGIIAVVSTLLVLMITAPFFDADLNNLLLAGFSAFLLFEVSAYFKAYGANGDTTQVLKGITYGLGAKLALVVAGYLAVRFMTKLDSQKYIIFLVAIYLLLFIFEFSYITRAETRRIKKEANDTI